MRNSSSSPSIFTGIRCFLLAVYSLCPPAGASAQTPILELHTEGTTRLPSDAVIAASRLKLGWMATRTELDNAAEVLFATGLFQSVNYQFQPKSINGTTGYVVTFLLKEDPAEGLAILDLYGLESARLWETVRSANLLIDKAMPQNEQALAYYRQAIEAALARLGRKDAVSAKNEVDPATGRMATVFQSAHRPLISSIRFEGSRKISAGSLSKALDPVLVGRNYSEREVRHLIDLNGKPRYEEMGYLKFAVHSVGIENSGEQAVNVSVLVDEGAQWRLGMAEIQGADLPLAALRKAADFPVGQIANWKRIAAGINEMERVLQRDGYLAVHAVAQRHYRAEAGQVDLVIQVDRGKQFHFGSLQLHGLSLQAEKQARSIWKLKEGDPMNTDYLAEFLAAAKEGPARQAHSLTRELKARHGSEVIDVAITFK
ncbi:POTRA domain-containing protein [Paludibaculum fermentans]|uniref:POTRA domain-containing protein n=1 Tax=Paludibaculum fermentans TaxID=1473598 RepID=A0A7S7NVU8_PALFE|nr:POTRA domain-containing protein [Paludibaculum fermentans]QOY90736.1 hypothetical protein IRI77_12555 [Paludibaculum fermentans]